MHTHTHTHTHTLFDCRWNLLSGQTLKMIPMCLTLTRTSLARILNWHLQTSVSKETYHNDLPSPQPCYIAGTVPPPPSPSYIPSHLYGHVIVSTQHSDSPSLPFPSPADPKAHVGDGVHFHDFTFAPEAGVNFQWWRFLSHVSSVGWGQHGLWTCIVCVLLTKQTIQCFCLLL